MGTPIYIAIDLKSFYASVECVERGLNPLDVCLVVADETRTPKTICLAVTPALKAYGVPARPRLFEVIEKVRAINKQRGNAGKSASGKELAERPDLALDYIVACPRMQLYMDYSTRIYQIFLQYIAPSDIHVYSVDEVFIDAAPYLDLYEISAHELAMRLIRDVLRQTGITATAGIGPNLYLCKVAMDIVAKKMPPDEGGVRIAELDEMGYRRQLWTHQPLTDFWGIGAGIAKRLAAHHIYTMGDLARVSLSNEAWLYQEFGVNAELLIDHAWGWEPVTMSQIREYRPSSKSMSVSQVLAEPYTSEKARRVVQEMAEEAALDLVDKKQVANQLVLTIGYDVQNLATPDRRVHYTGKIRIDHYGRPGPYHSHGTFNFEAYTASAKCISENTLRLYDQIVDTALLIRRLSLSFNHIIAESRAKAMPLHPQRDLFVNNDEIERREAEKNAQLTRERHQMEAILALRKRFGKNTVLKGNNFLEGTTQRERNLQIGGHKA